jgi:hypothetical protein
MCDEMKTIKKSTLFFQSFRGKRYRIVRIRKDVKTFGGNCDPPTKKGKYINIPLGRGPQAFEIQIHEALHACFWDLDDAAVVDAAISIGQFLWQLGWRNVAVPKAEGGQF